MKRLSLMFGIVVMFLVFSLAVAYAQVTWTTQRLTRNVGGSGGASIAVDGPNIYVVWVDGTRARNGDIYFKRSTDGGDTWTTRRLTRNAGFSLAPSIAIDGQNLYVVWDDDTPGNREIYFKRSTDEGDTWTRRGWPKPLCGVAG
jgi:hypothetical protein